MYYQVINTWGNNKVVFNGDLDECERYIRGNNSYQMNYSKLILKKVFKFHDGYVVSNDNLIFVQTCSRIEC